MPLLPEGSSLHINRPLTNISVAFQQRQSFVADRVFPTVPVRNQGDLYWKYNMGDWYRGEAEQRAPATESAGGGWEVDQDSYFAKVYAIHKDLDDQTRANADSNFNLEADASRWVTQQLLIKRDTLWASNFFTGSVWGLDRAGVTSNPSNAEFLRFDESGSDPIGLFRADRLRIRELTGYWPNTLVVGPEVHNELLDHSTILERIKYSERGVISTDLLASLFEVDRYVVADTVRNTAAQGAADAMDFVFGKSMLLCYSTPNPGLLEATAGYNFSWTGFLGAGAFATRIRRFRMDAISSHRVEGEMAFDMKVIAPELGTYYSAVIS